MPVRLDPSVRFGLGLAVLALARAAVRHDGVGDTEAAAFRTLNGLPDSLQGPIWVVMQGGNLMAAPAAAAVAARAGRPRAARRLLASGVATWTLAKVVKRSVGPPRPTGLLTGSRARGRPQTGFGFVSGHAGVATALCAAALPELGRNGRRLALGATAVVAGSRLYVGAHLPLDVVGGVALGVLVEAALELADL